MECTGSEANITGCKVFTGPNCPFIHGQVVGVRCHRDPQSLCDPGEYAHGSACYNLISSKVTTHERAKSLCEEAGSKLISIQSQVYLHTFLICMIIFIFLFCILQTESDFISELLINIAPAVTKVHTDGVAVKPFKKTLFTWEQLDSPINFTKWWPGNFKKNNFVLRDTTNV